MHLTETEYFFKNDLNALKLSWNVQEISFENVPNFSVNKWL